MKETILPGLIGLFDCCLLVDVLTGNREEDDDIGLELSPVSIASTDAAPGWSWRPFDPDNLNMLYVWEAISGDKIFLGDLCPLLYE